MSQLTDEHWDDIIATAIQYAKAPKAIPEDADVFGEESSDFELEDGDYDADTDDDLDTEGNSDAFDMDKQDPYTWNHRYTGSDEEEEIDQLEED